nr:MAG TPA: hypothetical protein [Caudoviricetes sp.]
MGPLPTAYTDIFLPFLNSKTIIVPKSVSFFILAIGFMRSLP